PRARPRSEGTGDETACAAGAHGNCTRNERMRTSPRNRGRRRMLGAAALTGTAALVLSACAGSIGGGSGGAGGGEGFEYGASQEEVDAVLEGLEPVTLTFQPGAASAESIMSPAATEIADRIEERS